MKIELVKIPVQDLTNGYQDNGESGVVGYGGRLNIRPPYQREFIYKDKQRNAVINTVTKDFPLNVMYWAVKENGDFEIIDGQQRTVSICQYVNNDFSIDGIAFHNLQKDKQDEILDYELMVYFCEGTDSERLEWFETINIAGEELTDQELRNAVYSGTWVTDAKRYFSKTNCVAHQIASDYLNGSAIRQNYLETAIRWISKGEIKEYMSNHQHDQNALPLFRYFQDVITWVKGTFVRKRSIMKGVDWGTLYNQFKDDSFDTDELERETSELILDDDVTNNKGIYPYLLTRKEKYLNIRAFTAAMKQKVYQTQEGKCAQCNEEFSFREMEADHITPWHEGGRTNEDNCQLLCKEDNRRKGGR